MSETHAVEDGGVVDVEVRPLEGRVVAQDLDDLRDGIVLGDDDGVRPAARLVAAPVRVGEDVGVVLLAGHEGEGEVGEGRGVLDVADADGADIAGVASRARARTSWAGQLRTCVGWSV